jgi:hypothetical protein
MTVSIKGGRPRPKLDKPRGFEMPAHKRLSADKDVDVAILLSADTDRATLFNRQSFRRGKAEGKGGGDEEELT